MMVPAGCGLPPTAVLTICTATPDASSIYGTTLTIPDSLPDDRIRARVQR